MPTLHCARKDNVINYHMDVPFKVLENKYNFELGDRGEHLPTLPHPSLFTHLSCLGKHMVTAYYFNKKQTAIDHALLATNKTKAEEYVIDVENCLLEKEYMAKQHIAFKKTT